MDWFKRYGIPGAYSMGLTLAWLVVLYPCRIDLRDEKTFKIMAGVFTGGFLPFGYMMYLVGQLYYLIRCRLSSRYGGHARARYIARTNFDANIPVDIEQWAAWAVRGIENANKKLVLRTPSRRRETILAACSVLQAVSSNWSEMKEKEPFAQEWIRKRNDIVVMNQAIMAATIVCSIGAMCLGLFLPDWSMQPQEPWHVILISIAVVCLYFIIWYVTAIFRIGIAIVIAGVFNLRRRSSVWFPFI